MKLIINNILSIAAAVLIAAGCSKPATEEVPVLDNALVGEWHLTQTEVDGSVLDTQHDIYIAFHKDCTFELFQKSGDQQRFTKLTGTCSLEDNRLTGIYSDGTPWGSAYTVVLAADSLTLTNETLTEVQTYRKEAVSEDIRNNADIKAKASNNDIIPAL